MQIGFIGSGKMASALLEGILQAGITAAPDVFVTDKFPAAAQALAEKTGAQARTTNAERSSTPIRRIKDLSILMISAGRCVM